MIISFGASSGVIFYFAEKIQKKCQIVFSEIYSNPTSVVRSTFIVLVVLFGLFSGASARAQVPEEGPCVTLGAPTYYVGEGGAYVNLDVFYTCDFQYESIGVSFKTNDLTAGV